MQISFQQSEKLPPLAWCIQIKEDSFVTVRHGTGVEVSETCFVEGAWDDAFEEFEFEKSFLLMGSGGKVVGNRLVLASPCHTLEKLYSVRLENQIFASNSLVFLLSQAQLQLDLEYKGYLLDQKTIVKGLKGSVKTIPTRSGPPVQMHYFSNVEIDDQLELRELAKNDPGEFCAFPSYRNFLVQSLSNISRNAQSDQRKTKYTLLTSISTGYDSPTCSAIASEAGCKESVTFVSPSWGARDSDSGISIAKHLGLQIKEYSNMDYLHKDGVPEAEFVAVGDAGDVVMGAFEKMLKSRIFVTGFHGDKVWDRLNKKVGPNIVRGDNSGSSLGEFRLRVGFIHCPVPFFGCIAHESIHKISQSEEMKPWTLGTQYDRPIARRILEERGVDRELFGQTKKAVATWWNFTPPKAHSAESYYAFRKEHRTVRGFLYECFHRGIHLGINLYRLFGRIVNWVLRKMGLSVQLPISFSFGLWKRFVEPADQNMLMQWAVSLISERFGTD